MPRERRAVAHFQQPELMILQWVQGLASRGEHLKVAVEFAGSSIVGDTCFIISANFEGQILIHRGVGHKSHKVKVGGVQFLLPGKLNRARGELCHIKVLKMQGPFFWYPQGGPWAQKGSIVLTPTSKMVVHCPTSGSLAEWMAQRKSELYIYH